MKILVGYNGSEVSKTALSQAKSYAKTYSALVYVVTSLEGGSGEKVEEIDAATEKFKLCPGVSGKRRDPLQDRATGARPHARGGFGQICQ